ncbi:MAG: recombinase family protein, partial [Methylococcales bacterium]
MAKIGYARTSSTGQHLNLQVEKLKAFGCVAPDGLIFTDQQNIQDIDDRAELQACLEHIQNGDLLVVTKLDRLTHST